MFKRTTHKISDNSPLQVKGLTLYPDRLSYKGFKCNLNDIKHIRWYWRVQIIGIFRSNEVELDLYVKNTRKQIRIKQSTLYIRPKLVEAYLHISKQTHGNRLNYYLDELSAKDRIIYNGITIDAKGCAYKNNKKFDLRLAKHEPFSLSVKTPGLFGARLSLDMSTDTDVVVPLIDYLCSTENPYLQQSDLARQNPFLADIIALSAKLAYVDGQVSPEEITVIKEFIVNKELLHSISINSAITHFNNAKSSPESFEAIGNRIKRANADEEFLQSFINILFTIAQADGVVSKEEELLLDQLQIIFGVKDYDFESFKSSRKQQNNKDIEFHLSVLGLDGDCSPEEIRNKYRRLVMKYHPDRLQHLSQEEQNSAMEKMKELNMSYAFLEQHYNFSYT